MAKRIIQIMALVNISKASFFSLALVNLNHHFIHSLKGLKISQLKNVILFGILENVS
jgi:hypothetical protein